jgi:hypothetical protein
MRGSNRESRKWQYLRHAYVCGLVALFVAIVYCRTNWILFHQLTWIKPSDYAAEIQSDCIPLIEAIGKYQRDFGYLPGPNEFQSISNGKMIMGGGPNEITWFDFRRYGETISYDFASNPPHWYVTGPWTQGTVPVPAVRSGPVVPPTTQPK